MEGFQLLTRAPNVGYAPEKIQYGIDRYQNETRRLYSVLETALQASKSGFLVGDRLTIADIASWGWVKAGREFFPSPSFLSKPPPSLPFTLSPLSLSNVPHTANPKKHTAWAGIDLDEFPALKAWKERLAERPAFAKGADVPAATEEEKRPKTKEEEERIAQEARDWILKGMQKDAAKKTATGGEAEKL